MFYNSKKLIDEKVLQQYYFEKFMVADAVKRKKLLPECYREDYSRTDSVKGLRPEVTLTDDEHQNHITDFVLYPNDANLPPLNIEIKWVKSDFEKPNQQWRYPYYDGSSMKGFVVCLNDEGENRDFNISNTQIPVVYLDVEDFKKWFTKNSFGIISQALSNKLKIPPSRLSGKKYWLVNLGKEAMCHYVEFGRPNKIWAFKDGKNPKNIMKILEGDYIIFMSFDSCSHGRMIYPHYNDNRMIGKNENVQSSNLSWSIGLIDIMEVKKGYHLDYSDAELYSGFEDKWKETNEIIIEEKEYTQFVRFSYNDSDDYQYMWDRNNMQSLMRNMFDGNDNEIVRLVDAMRESMNTSGDAREISYNAFQTLIQILHDAI